MPERSPRPRVSTWTWSLACLLALAMLPGCSSTSSAPSPERSASPVSLPREDRIVLLDPVASYPLEIDAERAAMLRRAHRLLVDEGAVSRAEAIASELLAESPELAPALLLRAQIAFARREYRAAEDTLAPLVAERPGYAAAQLLRGRTLEALGDLPGAYASFRAAAEVNPLAAERAAELLPRTLDILANRIDAALTGGNSARAEEILARLEAWGPEALVTLEARRRVALEVGDRERELGSLRALIARYPERQELLERQGELELTVGDPARGVEIYSQLAAAAPGDPVLENKLDSARFLWRVSLLPDAARQAAEQREVRRSDFATLLYWLVPDVRHLRPARPRIAADILEHPQREAISRVVNLGLMDVERNLHHFSPDASVRQDSALAALLKILEMVPRSPPACLGSAGPDGAAGSICGTALSCGLFDQPQQCRPQASISGPEAVELIRRALKRL